jgi:ribosomal protein S18 acetylase RimI-like enzyme
MGFEQGTRKRFMLRTTREADTPILIALAEGTGVFKPIEIEALREVLEDYHATLANQGHRSLTCESAGEILGFIYFAPAAMTDRSWYIYWVAVGKQRQGQGLGGLMLAQAEREIRQSGGRLLLIETSSLPHYQPTRDFYRKHGFEQEAVVRDYYANGDDLVVFRKRLC